MALDKPMSWRKPSHTKRKLTTCFQ
ncbi:BnaAnng14140D [Brassica napus]|uniref:BnaAnng14140D protein n=1 Tax=Brassica napus TaxID=3708 RepID=A0A078IWT2_BRANA|nr:BnaAnng14140D [Brassica napus]